MPPLREELAARLGLSSRDFREVLRYLCETGKAVEVPPEFAYHAHAYAEMLAVTKALFGAGAERTVSEIRQALDLNRKDVVPPVEHFDARGRTRREGNNRRWVAG
ncbi:MAG: SelB C-terminal domain-containing protein [Planctomycetota bacterium]|nr:SelB C-terminal domain-containing protein [Planctomycetota bacterium]